MIQKNNRTEKLYETDSHCREFTARVLRREKGDAGWEIVLDRTAFFPEGGGQLWDTGTLNGIAVRNVQEKDGEIVHFTDAPLEEGSTVTGKLDWEQRFERMQGHSGEHIVSGLIHTRYGLENVGFHLGSEDITLDFNGSLSREQLDSIEEEANRAVWLNLPVLAEYPSPEVLESLDYRSKLALTENVRIVTIPGYDACACCAPHVRSTGEIGLIKLLDCIRYKGGVRIHMLCGQRALADYRSKYTQSSAIAVRLSAKTNEIDAAVARLEEELSARKQEIASLKKELVGLSAAALPPTEGNLVLFNRMQDKSLLRDFANAALPRCKGICAVFLGDDSSGWQYVLTCAGTDLRPYGKAFNAALAGKGGGSAEMITGSVKAVRAEIETYLQENPVTTS